MATFYHYAAPFTSRIKDPTLFRDMLWMDENEIKQRDELDRKIIEMALDAELLETTKTTSRVVRKERSLSEPHSIILNTNYRYVLQSVEIAQFLNSVEGPVFDVLMELHSRVGIGYAPTLIDKLITRTYVALTVVPTENNLSGRVDHAQYPYFWIFPYVRSRINEIISVGTGHN